MMIATRNGAEKKIFPPKNNGEELFENPNPVTKIMRRVVQKEVKAKDLIKDHEHIFSVPFGGWGKRHRNNTDHFAGSLETKRYFLSQGRGFKTRFFGDKAFCVIRNTGLAESLREGDTVESFFHRILVDGVSPAEDDIICSLHASLLKTKELAPNSTRDLFHFKGQIYLILVFVSSRKPPYRSLESMKSISDELILFHGYNFYTRTNMRRGGCRNASVHIGKDFCKKRSIKNVRNLTINDFGSRKSVINENAYVICGNNGPCAKIRDLKFLGLNLIGCEMGFRATKGEFFPQDVISQLRRIGRDYDVISQLRRIGRDYGMEISLAKIFFSNIDKKNVLLLII